MSAPAGGGAAPPRHARLAVRAHRRRLAALPPRRGGPSRLGVRRAGLPADRLGPPAAALQRGDRIPRLGRRLPGTGAGAGPGRARPRGRVDPARRWCIARLGAGRGRPPRPLGVHALTALVPVRPGRGRAGHGIGFWSRGAGDPDGGAASRCPAARARRHRDRGNSGGRSPGRTRDRPRGEPVAPSRGAVAPRHRRRLVRGPFVAHRGVPQGHAGLRPRPHASARVRGGRSGADVRPVARTDRGARGAGATAGPVRGRARAAPRARATAAGGEPGRRTRREVARRDGGRTAPGADEAGRGRLRRRDPRVPRGRAHRRTAPARLGRIERAAAADVGGHRRGRGSGRGRPRGSGGGRPPAALVLARRASCSSSPPTGPTHRAAGSSARSPSSTSTRTSSTRTSPAGTR